MNTHACRCHTHSVHKCAKHFVVPLQTPTGPTLPSNPALLAPHTSSLPHRLFHTAPSAPQRRQHDEGPVCGTVVMQHFDSLFMLNVRKGPDHNSAPTDTTQQADNTALSSPPHSACSSLHHCCCLTRYCWFCLIRFCCCC